jgi:hypothetical protein
MTKEIIAVTVEEIAPDKFLYKFYEGSAIPIDVTPEFKKTLTPTLEHFAAIAVRGTWEKLKGLFLLPPDPNKDDSTLPIIALKMIGKNQFKILFFSGEEFTVNWATDKEISYEEAAARCHDLLMDAFKKSTIDFKEKGGEWSNPKTTKPDTTN